MRKDLLKVRNFSTYLRLLRDGHALFIFSLVVATGVTRSYAAPSGGVVTSGTASIVQNGTVTNINQNSPRASINWQKFSINPAETVNFNQPNVNAITLNRVVGNEKSIIDGALHANGQVWILNSNGVLFNSNAKISTSGLIATTKSISDEDFQNGNFRFDGDSAASVINLGTIDISNGGYASLLAHTVANEGKITAIKGTVTLTGAAEATINFNGNSLVSVTVDKGILNALVENKGAVIADGGEIYLTTNAANELLKGVVNNSGKLQANALDDITGHIEVFAHGGTAHIGGIITAAGGFVETSGREFMMQDGANITAKEWLIDPVDITINSTLANSISTALNSGNVTITTDGTNTPSTASGESGTNGDITVSSSITKTLGSDTTLTLRAARNITIDSGAAISSTSGKLNTVLWANNSGTGGGITINDGSSILTNGGHLWLGGGSGSSIWNGLTVGNSYAQGVGAFSGSGGSGISLNGSSAITLDTSGGDSYLYGRGAASGGYGIYSAFATLQTGSTGAITLVGEGNSTVAGNATAHGINLIESSGIAGSRGLTLIGTANLNNLRGNQYGLNLGNSVLYAKNGGAVTINVSTTNSSSSNRYINLESFGENSSIIGDTANQTGPIAISATGTSTAAMLLPNIVTLGNLTINVGNSNSCLVTQEYTDFFGSAFTSRMVIGGTSGFTGNTTTAYRLTGTNNDFSGNVSVTTGTTLTVSDTNSLPIQTITGISGAINLTAPGGISLTYALTNKSGYTYSGNTVDLSSLWGPSSMFGASFASSWLYGTDYIFKDGSGNAVANYTNAGTYSGITVDILKSGYSTAVSGNTAGGLTISKANATVTGNSDIVTYNGQTQSANGYTVTGLVNGETAAILDSVAISGSGKNAGTYAVTGTASDNNYNLTVVNGLLTINRAPLSITAVTNTKTYDGTTSATATPTVSGLIGSDTATGLSEAYSNKDSGTGKTLLVNGYTINDGNGGNNYTVTTTNNTTGVINKASAIVTAVANTKTYDGTTSAAAIPTVSGLLGSDTATGLSEAYSNKDSGTGKTLVVNGYIINDGNGGNNYTVTTANNSSGVINKANANVTANSDTKTYNGQTQVASGYTATGLVNGETAAVLVGITEAGGSGINVGNYSHTLSGTDANYNLTFVNGTLAINKANATVNVNSSTVTYNGQVQASNGFTASGLVNGEAAAVLDNVVINGSGKNVGTYSVTGTASDNNYNLTVTNGILTINKAPLAITAASNTKTYDGTTSAAAIPTVSGLLGSDTATGLSEAYSNKDSGTGKTLVVNGYIINDGNGGNNYTVTTANNSAGVINKANATVTINNSTLNYNGQTLSAPANGYSVTGLVNGETAAVLDNVTVSGSGKYLGAYVVTGTASDNNYDLSVVNGSLTIAKNQTLDDSKKAIDSIATTLQTQQSATTPGTSASNQTRLETVDAVMTTLTKMQQLTALKDSGVSPTDLKNAGYSAEDLKKVGYPLADLMSAGYSAADLTKAGCSLTDLKNANYSSIDLKKAGYSLTDLKNANYSAIDLKKAGFSASELKSAGYEMNDLMLAGFSNDEMKNAYSAQELKAMGGSAAALKNMGYSLNDLKSAGFSARDLKKAGYSIDDLTNAGFSVKDLKSAGYGSGDLKAAGFSADALLAAGYNSSDLKKAGYEPNVVVSALNAQRLGSTDILTFIRSGGELYYMSGVYGSKELKNVGYSVYDLKANGYTTAAILEAGYTASELKNSNYSAQELKGAGYSANDLKSAGYSANDLKNAGYSTSSISSADYSAADMKNAGYSASDLSKSGYSPSDLKNAGYSANDLKNAGISSVTSLKSLGYSAKDLKNAGYSASDLKNAGYSASDLKSAGYSVSDLKNAGFAADTLKSAGYSANDLKNGGFPATDVKKAGYSQADILSTGYSSGDLKAAGYSAGDLKSAKYSISDLKEAGYSATDLKNTGYSIGDLKNAGYSAADLKAAGYSIGDMKKIGYSANDLKSAGYTAGDLKNIGYTTVDLRGAGYSASVLKSVGYTASDLKTAYGSMEVGSLRDAGYSASDLKSAGFDPYGLRIAGYSANDFKTAGYSGADMRAAGFSAGDLKSIGYSLSDLKNAGYSVDDLKRQGYSLADMKNAGYSATDFAQSRYNYNGAYDLKRAGFSLSEIKNAYYNVADVINAGFSMAEVKNAGYTASDLHKLGYSARELISYKNAPYSAKEMKNGGYSAKDLKEAFSAKDLKAAGFSDKEIIAAGYEDYELKHAGISR